MRRFWIVYVVIGLLMAGYTALGKIASHTPQIAVQLNPASIVQASILRLSGGQLRISAYLSGVRHGSERSRFDDEESASFQIELSAEGQAASRFALGRTIGWGADRFERELLRVAGPPVHLKPGLTQIELKVASVDPPLRGQFIEVWADPALGFKSADDAVQWLWYSFLSLFYLPAYVAIGLGAAGIHFWRTRG